MEDKMFELMSKIYGELTEFRTETNKKLDSLEGDIIRLENKLDTNSKTLFDSYKRTYKKVTDVENAVNNLSLKV